MVNATEWKDGGKSGEGACIGAAAQPIRRPSGLVVIQSAENSKVEPLTYQLTSPRSTPQWPFEWSPFLLPWIEDLNAGIHEIFAVSGNQDELSGKCGCGDKGVNCTHLLAFLL
jgi:hypothetical protein